MVGEPKRPTGLNDSSPLSYPESYLVFAIVLSPFLTKLKCFFRMSFSSLDLGCDFLYTVLIYEVFDAIVIPFSYKPSSF